MATTRAAQQSLISAACCRRQRESRSGRRRQALQRTEPPTALELERVATARGLAEAEPHFAAPMTTAPVTARPARQSRQMSLEELIYSYFNPGVNRSNSDVRIRRVRVCRMPSEKPRRRRIGCERADAGRAGP